MEKPEAVTSASVGDEGSPEKRVVRSAIDAFNAGDLETYFSLHTVDTRVVEPGAAGEESAEDYRARLQRFREANPNARVTIRRLHADGPWVVMESDVTVDATTKERPIREAVVFELLQGLIDQTTVYSSEGLMTSPGTGENSPG